MGRIVRGSFAALVPVAALGLAACQVSPAATAGPGQPPAGAQQSSEPTQVWMDDRGLVSLPALPAAAPTRRLWSVDARSVFADGAVAMPELPDPPGRFAGLTKDGQLLAYDTNGKRAWRTPLPALTAPEEEHDTRLADSVQVPGVSLFAVKRTLADHSRQIDVFDAATGTFLWSRVGDLDMPRPVDAQHLELDLGAGHGVDALDPRTGKVLWHNPAADRCSARAGSLLCDQYGGSLDGTGDALLGVDPATGATRWSYQHPVALKNRLNSFDGVVDGRVYLTDGETDNLTALDLATGKQLWQVHSDINEVSDVVPLGANQVAVTGLKGSSQVGWTTVVDTIVAATGSLAEPYQSSTTATDDTPRPPRLVVIGGTSYLLIEDSDGTLHVFDADGKRIADADKGCGDEYPQVVGPVFGCHPDDDLVVYDLPDLSRRATVHLTGHGASIIHAIAGSWVIEDGDALAGLG